MLVVFFFFFSIFEPYILIRLYSDYANVRKHKLSYFSDPFSKSVSALSLLVGDGPAPSSHAHLPCSEAVPIALDEPARLLVVSLVLGNLTLTLLAGPYLPARDGVDGAMMDLRYVPIDLIPI